MEPSTDVIVRLVAAAPIAAALIYLVIIFLRSLDKRDEKLHDIQKEWSESMKTVNERSNGVIDRNTNVLIEFKAVVEKCKAKEA